MPASSIRKPDKTPGRTGSGQLAVRAPVAKAPAPQTGKAVQTRQKILDAAATIFATRGFTATNLNDIAKAAAMKSGSLYFHFTSKDELIAEVLREGIARTLVAVETAVAALGDKADSRERICTAIRTHVRQLHSMGSYGAAVTRIVEEVTPEIRASFRADEGRYSTCWRNLIEQAQRDKLMDSHANPRHIRSILFAAMNATARLGGTPEIAEQGARLVIALFGLGPKSKRRK